MSAETARSGSRPGAADVPRHDFVQKLVRDPGNLSHEDGMLLLSGFVGDSDEPGYTRIYCEPTLDCYADVRDDDILHHQPDPDGGPGQTWARRDAKVKYGRRGEGKRQAAGFLEGALVQDYRRPTGGDATGPEQFAPIATGAYCPTRICSQMFCPTSALECTRTVMWCAAYQQPGAFQQVAPAAQVGPTGWYGCTHLLGCPNSISCPPLPATWLICFGYSANTQWTACYPG